MNLTVQIATTVQPGADRQFACTLSNPFTHLARGLEEVYTLGDDCSAGRPIHADGYLQIPSIYAMRSPILDSHETQSSTVRN